MLDLAVWTLVAFLAALVLVHRRLVGALWAQTEDPRTLALLRIVTGALVLGWLWDLAPLLQPLYSSEGIFTGEQARRAFGGVGRWSWLYTYDSPAMVQAHAAVLAAAALSLMVGLATRVATWVTLVAFSSLVARNGLVVGGEQVFACMLFGLALSRCGHAWSIDAWWAARRRGEGLRAIPAWPRYLLILQTIPMFFANGLAKYGPMWRDGDTVHYTFNHPHFRPGEVYALSAMFGTNLFRVMTWVVHAFELCVPLAVVGLGVRFVRHNPGLLPEGRARLVARILGVAIGLNVIALAMLRLPPQSRDTMPFVVSIVAGVAIALGPVVVAVARRVPARMLAWGLGRRVWVTLWILFTGQLALVLHIGWFTAMVLGSCLVFFRGEELGRIASWFRRRPAVNVPLVEPRPAWGFGRQRLALAVSALHVAAVLVAVLPVHRPLSPWRRTIERPLQAWVQLTTYAQFWRMFAPSGAARVHEVELSFRSDDGEVVTLGSGLVPPAVAGSTRSLDKQQKLSRRLAGRGGERHRAAFVAWACRHHGGRLPGPGTLELVRVSSPIPSPRALAELGVEEAVARAEAERQRTVLFGQPCRP